ncbi:hypothetical protein HMPREF0063_10044 [Aeromicrobium marinum DSM 15272]|uniref:N-acetylmuramoyl-L-alanine amidase n=1 Tax=Aeromicrobium marinum DSM 15272 TaxID=585531 RepID=E2S7N7_9ACTN|nr:N-acetylmuramoyl-L-alanine amidase [Aeromicrobium marinum]EFQ84703.1 hypothetical protein HMPREF0063_10044 [Aeromicrobium marinum DSM 15272]
MLTDLADACRKSGLRVVEVPGWKHEGRPGTFSPRGVAAHHTADTLSDHYSGAELTRREEDYARIGLSTGHRELPGPLCQIGLGRDGTVYVIAAGRANHAGKVRSWGGWVSAGDGNTQAIGIEAMNSAYEGWSDTQSRAYHRLCAALCDHYGWPRSRVAAHGEISTSGKWDPGVNGRLIDMNAFRAAVAGVTQGDDDMQNTEEQYEIFRHFLARALRYDIRPLGAGADWKLGPTLWERLAQIEGNLGDQITAIEGADVDEIAQQVVESLDDDLAEKVLALLADRIGGKS